MPKLLMFSRLASMLIAYLVLYRLSRWLSLAQGKLSQPKQYLCPALAVFSQFLIRHMAQDFDLRLSSPLQPGHGFFSLPNARHRRQFIPQGAISLAGIAFFSFINPAWIRGEGDRGDRGLSGWSSTDSPCPLEASREEAGSWRHGWCGRPRARAR